MVVKTTVHNLGAAAAVETAQVYATAPLDNIVRGAPPWRKRVLALEARTLNATGQSRVTLSLQ